MKNTVKVLDSVYRSWLVRLSPRNAASPFHHVLCWKPGTLARWECAAFVGWLSAALR